jgi:hypothetical protein
MDELLQKTKQNSHTSPLRNAKASTNPKLHKENESSMHPEFLA